MCSACLLTPRTVPISAQLNPCTLANRTAAASSRAISALARAMAASLSLGRLINGVDRRLVLLGLTALLIVSGALVPYASSYAMLMLGFGLANLLPIFGPVKPWGGPERVDEFDRALRARAFLAAFSALAAVAVIGLWAIVGLSLVQGWTADALRSTVMKLAFVLATIYTAGPTCYASWARAPIDED